MQPRTTLEYKQDALKRLQRKMKVTKSCSTQRDGEPTYAMDLPYEIGLKLTNRCNLRCTHCFQWNEEGYHNHLSKPELGKSGDLDIEIIRNLLEATREIKSLLYVWGGEPMIYHHWKEFVDLLEADPRETTICTNGLYLVKEMESLLRISKNLTTLVSVEGLEKHHDKLRGKNTFKRIVENMQALIEAQRRGEYHGFVSVAGVLSDDLIPDLYDACCYFESLGIDTLYFNFPWYINNDLATSMDDFFLHHFAWMGTFRGEKNSWRSFDFHLNPDLIGELMNQLERIRAKKWSIRIRFQPEMDDAEIMDFVKGTQEPVQSRTRCLSISNRIDLMPDGKVVPCKKFPEFSVGNMKESSLKAVWHGEDFKKFRALHNNTLMPICSKCELLYSNGI